MAAKTFTTKPFLLATAGSTVDGRTIEDKQLKELASSYDPKTYGARVNIEHIRGVSGSAPFIAYGDLLALTTGEVDVNFNGKTRIDTIGHPVSEKLHTIERFKRRDMGHIDYTLTIDDPKVYTKPWDSVRIWTARPDWEIMEYSCEENNKDIKDGHIKQGLQP